MRRLKLTGFAVIAILALAAMAMAGTATALEILPTPTKAAPLLFTDSGLVGTLTTLKGAGKSTVTCQKNKSKGEFTTATLGTDEIKFEECTTEKNTLKCTGLADVANSGSITVKKAAVHFTDGLLSAKQVSAFAILLLEDVHFTCGGLVLVIVLMTQNGCSAGLVLSEFLDTLVKEVKVSFLLKEKIEGDPDIPFINLPTESNCELKVATNEAKEEDMGAIMQEEETITGFTQLGVEVTVLLHTK